LTTFFYSQDPQFSDHFNKSEETIKQQSLIDGEFPTSNGLTQSHFRK